MGNQIFIQKLRSDLSTSSDYRNGESVLLITWIFGRGLSIGCNLTWSVPDSFKNLERQEQIAEIKRALLDEINNEDIDTTTIKTFLKILSEKTPENVSNLFVTTNWDYLLQKEIDALNLEYLPTWLIDSHVYHLNGTVEKNVNSEFGSPFLLEDDSYKQRYSSVEGNNAFNRIVWGSLFFVVGMSFECEVDRSFLYNIKLHEDNLPIGESRWFIINPDKNGLDAAAQRVASCLPRAKVYPIEAKFGDRLIQSLVINVLQCFADKSSIHNGTFASSGQQGCLD